ncbi:MAG: signal peptidase I [Candidatus Paceibacterota bacterium]|jgi:signal peptidase I|nr:signal peptidase I [Candidatus Paceibacterota bacterium]
MISENNKNPELKIPPFHPKMLENEPQNTGSEDVSTGSFIMEIIKFTIISILIVAPIRLFIAQPFIVRGESMDPTYSDGQYLIVDELTYRKEQPERGDVIVFKYPKDPSKYFIKRIIGLPNEKVSVSNGIITITGAAYPSGKVLNEPYIKELSYDNFTETLGENEYFVMGDNRSNSLDSRMWGPLHKKNIIGRVFVRLFPLQTAGLFPGKQNE